MVFVQHSTGSWWLLTLHLLLVATVYTGLAVPATALYTPIRKVVNGQTATLGQFPYAAHLFRRGRTICGGTLISHQHILTAAHCVVRRTNATNNATLPMASSAASAGNPPLFEVNSVDDYRVTLGYLPSDLQHERRITHIQVDQFNTTTSEQDLAVLTLDAPVTFTRNVHLARIGAPAAPAQTDLALAPGEQLVSMGWGRNASFQSTEELRWLTMVVGQSGLCRHASPEYVSPTKGPFICVVGERADTGVCVGDSGGPLAVQRSSQDTSAAPKILGVLSFGASGTNNQAPQCNSTDLQQLYVRVADRLPFIASATGMAVSELTSNSLPALQPVDGENSESGASSTLAAGQSWLLMGLAAAILWARL